MDSPFSGRSDRIRTCGILLPKQARYQLRYTPIILFFCSFWPLRRRASGFCHCRPAALFACAALCQNQRFDSLLPPLAALIFAFQLRYTPIILFFCSFWSLRRRASGFCHCRPAAPGIPLCCAEQNYSRNSVPQNSKKEKVFPHFPEKLPVSWPLFYACGPFCATMLL